MQMSSFLLYKVDNKRPNVRQMFNRPGTPVFNPTTLHIPKTRSVIHKDGVGEPLGLGASATKKSSFVKEANRARDTIATALASIKNLPARDDREGVSSSYRDEYTQSIRTLDRIIRREWNHAITTYLSAPESLRSSSQEPRSPFLDFIPLHSRSPSPSPPRKSNSSDSVEY